MNDEQQNLIQQIKRDVRKAVEKATGEPLSAMITLRKVLESILLSVFDRAKNRLPDDTKNDPNITRKIGPLLRAFKDSGIIPAKVADCGFIANDNLKGAAHDSAAPPTASDIVRPLKNLLRLLSWFEQDCRAANTSGTSTNVAAGTEYSRDPDGPYAGMSVNLQTSAGSSDVAEEWLKLRNRLLADGVTLISDDPAARETRKETLFVQLFSSLDCLTEVRTQLNNSIPDPGSVMQWRKALPNPGVDWEIVESLDADDKKFCQCETVRTGSFEEFCAAVRNRLDQLKGTATRETPIVYIAYDNSNRMDAEYNQKLVEVAAESVHVKQMISRIDIPMTVKQKRWFWNELKTISGIVFLYGDTKPEFIGELVNSYIDGKRLKKPNIKRVAIYQAPPTDVDMKSKSPAIGLSDREYTTYGSRDQFNPNDIEPYCAELKS